MSTTSSIGTASRTYSTVAAWLSAFTTGGWIGECYNDSEFTVTAAIDFSGHAVGASDYITLQCAAGQSFRNHASVQTNALRYNQSNGVGIRKTNAYTRTVTVGESYVTLKHLQIAHTGGASTDFSIYNNTASTAGVVVDGCIFECAGENATWRSGTMRNCLLVQRSSAGDGLSCDYATSPIIVNCTIVRPSDKTIAGNALVAFTGTSTIKNCAFFGYSTDTNDDTKFTGSNNCSDVAIGFGTSNQASKTYANQFQNTADATRDFRLKAGADCIGNGVTDTTNVPASDDIAGTTRT